LLIYHRRAPAEREPLAEIVVSAARVQQREEEIADMSNTIAEELMQEGEARGEARGKQEVVLRVLQIRFSQVPETLRQRIRTLTDAARLDDLLVRAVTASRWEEVTLE
jgi:predicted transposase YdaD